jgi:hypothetical protein
MKMLRAGNIKKTLLLTGVLVFSLSFPFSIFNTDGSFDIISILFFIRYDSIAASMIIRFIPYYDFILPALLICVPCLLWLWKSRDMKTHTLLGSAGLVVLVLTAILLYYLPFWVVLPWLYQGLVPRYIPELYNLIPFSGIVFTIMVLLPLFSYGFTYYRNNNLTLREKIVAPILSLFVVLSPLTIESFSLEVSGPFPYYTRGFNLQSVFWIYSYDTYGNNLGHSAMISLETTSVYAVLALTALSLPGVIFIWLALKSHYDRYTVASIVTAGAIHLLTLFVTCIWISNVESHPIWWIVIPSPVILIGGLIIIAIRAYYMLNRKRQLSQTNITMEPPIQPQM